MQFKSVLTIPKAFCRNEEVLSKKVTLHAVAGHCFAHSI